MKDYLNAEEKNHIMVIGALIRMMNRVENTGKDGPRIQNIIDSWTKSNNLTKDEQRSLKMAQTYLEKFFDSVTSRMNPKEQDQLKKKLSKFDFRLIDDFTLEKVYRDMRDKLVNAAVPRDQFCTWCDEIMHHNCNGCTKHWEGCELHQVFEDNFVPESSWGLENCRYAYKLP